MQVALERSNTMSEQEFVAVIQDDEETQFVVRVAGFPLYFPAIGIAQDMNEMVRRYRDAGYWVETFAVKGVEPDPLQLRASKLAHAISEGDFVGVHISSKFKKVATPYIEIDFASHTLNLNHVVKVYENGEVTISEGDDATNAAIQEIVSNY